MGVRCILAHVPPQKILKELLAKSFALQVTRSLSLKAAYWPFLRIGQLLLSLLWVKLADPLAKLQTVHVPDSRNQLLMFVSTK